MGISRIQHWTQQKRQNHDLSNYKVDLSSSYSLANANIILATCCQEVAPCYKLLQLFQPRSRSDKDATKPTSGKSFADASQCGEQPALICIDGSCRRETRPPLLLAFATGRWTDVALHFRDTSPTFSSGRISTCWSKLPFQRPFHCTRLQLSAKPKKNLLLKNSFARIVN